ncbi:MAG: copper amine oxidase N-terminal domain-containing protein [Veillonella sp.]|uniref:copper amine oxidase N-terminal domain-containing protein n=1 Tax=Veillonella sp. TaxID=1926307 RepID=UPI00257FC942|nr:copper amine oxidase N-terminal domain-containing protein [Veillonella sp.]MBS5756296.1 copper amine oxidase N-terminal domain-containing protein [Veillonella sp.]
MKLKQLILSSIALGALAFTVGMAQPAHAAIGMETPAPAQNLEKPASVTTQHHINVDGKVLEPVKDHQNVAYVDGQPLVALRQVSDTLAIQPDQAQIVRKGKLQIINLDTSESMLPTPRMIDGQLFVSPSAFKLLLNDVKITKDEIFIAPQRAQLASTTNTNGPHKNEISTFLPPSDNTSAKVETSSKVESNTKSAAKDEPLIKVKHTQTTDKNTK